MLNYWRCMETIRIISTDSRKSSAKIADIFKNTSLIQNHFLFISFVFFDVSFCKTGISLTSIKRQQQQKQQDRAKSIKILFSIFDFIRHCKRTNKKIRAGFLLPLTDNRLINIWLMIHRKVSWRAPLATIASSELYSIICHRCVYIYIQW